MKIRPAAVAGLFYEGDSSRLQSQVDNLLGDVISGAHPPPRALIVPHAGYVYSGSTAAQAYALLAPLREKIHRVALFGPAHTVYLKGMAVPGSEAFNTPLGNIPLDRSAVARLTTLPGVHVSDEAHEREHSLEVQLPFLQRALKEFQLVPVAVGECSPEEVASAMEMLWQDEETLLVVSSDLSHFHTYEQARTLDRLTCQRIASRASDLSGQEACGARAINGLMCSHLGHTLELELLHLCNSGDTAGDKRRVVGYGAFSLH